MRPATAADVPQLAILCRQALAEKAPTRGGEMYVAREARAEPIEVGLVAELADSRHRLWAGTIDDVVVGYASVRVEDLRTGDRLGVIEDLYVEEEARAVGVGEGLMEQILEWLRGEGCQAVDATALPGDRNTKNFFEMSGFTARLLVMHHRLS